MDVGVFTRFFFLVWEFLLYNGDFTLLFVFPLGRRKQQAVLRHRMFDSGKSFFSICLGLHVFNYFIRSMEIIARILR